MELRIGRLFGAILILSRLWAAPQYPPKTVALNVEKAFTSLRSLRADFEQSYYSASMATPLVEKGRLYLQKPDLMRWEYREPERNVFLYREGISLAYFPEDNQLYRHALSPEEKDWAIFSLLTGRAKILDTYDVEAAEFPAERKPAVQIKLVPKTEGETSHILLQVDPRTWLLERIVFFDWTGNKQEFTFSGLKLNPRLEARTFELDVPADCEVIDDLSPARRQPKPNAAPSV
jgi:outer membrane lipoprotein-sorting protein